MRLALSLVDCQLYAALGPRGNARLPTYEYHCDSCEKNFDLVQSFHDDPLTDCPTCGSPVRKVFGNVGIVFKGSGFYKTDSRNGSSGKAPDSTESTPVPSSDSDRPSSDSDRSASAAEKSSSTPSDGPAKPSPSPSASPSTSSPDKSSPAKTKTSNSGKSDGAGTQGS